MDIADSKKAPSGPGEVGEEPAGCVALFIRVVFSAAGSYFRGRSAAAPYDRFLYVVNALYKLFSLDNYRQFAAILSAEHHVVAMMNEG